MTFYDPIPDHLVRWLVWRNSRQELVEFAERIARENLRERRHCEHT